MDKQELENVVLNPGFYEKITVNGKNYTREDKVLSLIDQLDEPEITTEQAWEKIAEEYSNSSGFLKELFNEIIDAFYGGYPRLITKGSSKPCNPALYKEKPEIPRKLAGMIEELKEAGYSDEYIVYDIYTDKEMDLMDSDIERWINYNVDSLTKAVANGYTIVKEPVWIVKFNNPINKYWTYFTAFKGTDDKEVSWIDSDESQPNYIGNPLSHAHPFKSKDKAEAVATLTDGTVEEWSE